MIATNVLCIVNPASGQHAVTRTQQLLKTHLTEAGIGYEVRKTARAGDAERWATCAQREGFDAVLSCGGDGTVTETLTGLLKAETVLPLALLPLGTANLAAKALGVPLRPSAALRLLSCGKVVSFDVAYLPDHRRYFLLLAGSGWDARLIAGVPPTLRRRLRFAAYLLLGVKNLCRLRYTQAQVTLTLDGVRRQIVAHTVLLANVGRLGSWALGPGISLHDGQLDVIAIASSGPGGVASLAWRLVTGRLAAHRDLHYFKAATVHINAEPPLPVQLDGELIGETPFYVEVVPGGARMVVPASYPDAKIGS